MNTQESDLAETRVCDLVTSIPARGGVLSKYNLDFCCGGEETLSQACELRGIAIEDVIRDIEYIDLKRGESRKGEFDAMSATELCDHIESNHHEFLKQHLPIVAQHANKVALVHGEREPYLKEIASVFTELKNELEPHMLKEEQILFPLIRQLDGSTTLPESHCGSVHNPIRAMFMEHRAAGIALERLRVLSSNYVPPPHACNTYRALFDELMILEQDTHIHIHKENHILFPKAKLLEEGLSHRSLP